MYKDIITQEELKHSIESIPVEYFQWGTYPDHFKMKLPHRHQFSELLFFTEGGGIHEIDCIDHDIVSCSVHYVPRSTVHFLRREQNSAGFNIAFDATFFENNSTHRFLSPMSHEPMVWNFSKDQFHIILDQTNQIVHQIKQHPSYYRQKCFLISMELLLFTLAAAKGKEEPIVQEQDDFIRRFTHLVQTSHHEHTQVSWYADQMNVTPKHLGNRVKNSLATSAKKYILNILLQSIKRQLLDSDKSIKQIAADYRYGPSALGKLFRVHVGCSMKSYRSQAK